MYEERTYRTQVSRDNLAGFQVSFSETDIFVRADRDLSKKTKELITKYRKQLEEYITNDPCCLTTLEPYKLKREGPFIVKDMAKAGRLAGVGPMASVAGAMAEYVGRGLLEYSQEVIVENGGDIFLRAEKKRWVGIYVGMTSPYAGKLALEIEPKDTPLGISTSSGTIGHSLSFGKADAAVVISKSGALADACATALGNMVKIDSDIPGAIDFGKSIRGVKGILVIIEKEIGLWGEIKLIKL